MVLLDIIGKSRYEYSDNVQLKSGIEHIIEYYSYKGVIFSVTVRNSHSFKVRGGWDLEKSSDDGLKPDATASYIKTITNNDISLWSVKGIRVNNPYAVNRYLNGDAFKYLAEL